MAKAAKTQVVIQSKIQVAIRVMEAAIQQVVTTEIHVMVKKDPRFERDGDDLTHEARLSFPQMALGCEIEVPILKGGRAKVKVPAGTQHCTLLRVREHGMPRFRGRGHGDLHQ